MYLLDTNVVSELRKPHPDAAVLDWLKKVPETELFLPAVVLGELQRGVEELRPRDPHRAIQVELWVDQVAAAYEVLPMDGRVFREWARLVHKHPAHLAVDALIAATARIHKLTVVSRNSRDFQRLGTNVLNPFSSAT